VSERPRPSGDAPPGSAPLPSVTGAPSDAAAGSASGGASNRPTMSGAPERHERGEFAGASKRRKGPYSAAECGGAPPADLLKGIHEFNEGEFFEQHETLETLWRETTEDVRYLYQGILLVGVGFYHLGRGNHHGAQAKLAAGIEMLEWFAPTCQTVDVADLIARARPCLDQVRALGKDRLADFDRALIPRIRLLS
jgi:uncharacterized protein